MPDDASRVRRRLPDGQAPADLGERRRQELPGIPNRGSCRERDLGLAAIVLRVLAPGSNLAAARNLPAVTATSSLWAALRLGAVSGNETLYLLEWLPKRRSWIEMNLANRPPKGGAFALDDVTSSDPERRKCPLAAYRHNRVGEKGKKRIVF